MNVARPPRIGVTNHALRGIENRKAGAFARTPHEVGQAPIGDEHRVVLFLRGRAVRIDVVAIDDDPSSAADIVVVAERVDRSAELRVRDVEPAERAIRQEVSAFEPEDFVPV
jgi:hypothetical protein